MKTKTKTIYKSFRLYTGKSDEVLINMLKDLRELARFSVVLFLSLAMALSSPFLVDPSAAALVLQGRFQDEIPIVLGVQTTNASTAEDTAQDVDEFGPEIVKTETILDEGLAKSEFQVWKVVSSAHHVMTAYNSDVAQCDASPCITANGFNVCKHGIEDTVAANFLPFGTSVRIPELFGDRIFVVRDRMNSRYTSRVDVWMINKADAKQFGVKVAKIEVLEKIE